MRFLRVKILLLVLLVAGLSAAGTSIILNSEGGRRFASTSGETSDAVRYGTFSGFFTTQEIISYPLFLDSLRTTSGEGTTSLMFGPSGFKGFQVFMSVTQASKTEAERMKAMYLDRHSFPEGVKSTGGGYSGELLSSDNRAHPDPNMQTCSFGYTFFIPLRTSDHALILDINAQDPNWGMPTFEHCTIFDDDNYTALKGVMDHVIANIQPAF
ncbi:MAG: hypothetical protein WCG83_00615 [Candidatus Peregrinibacteria bacterium]